MSTLERTQACLITSLVMNITEKIRQMVCILMPTATLFCPANQRHFLQHLSETKERLGNVVENTLTASHSPKGNLSLVSRLIHLPTMEMNSARRSHLTTTGTLSRPLFPSSPPVSITTYTGSAISSARAVFAHQTAVWRTLPRPTTRATLTVRARHPLSPPRIHQPAPPCNCPSPLRQPLTAQRCTFTGGSRRRSPLRPC